MICFVIINTELLNCVNARLEYILLSLWITVVLSHGYAFILLGMHRRWHTYVYFLTESGIKGLVIPSQENLSIK